MAGRFIYEAELLRYYRNELDKIARTLVKLARDLEGKVEDVYVVIYNILPNMYSFKHLEEELKRKYGTTKIMLNTGTSVDLREYILLLVEGNEEKAKEVGSIEKFLLGF